MKVSVWNLRLLLPRLRTLPRRHLLQQLITGKPSLNNTQTSQPIFSNV